MIRNSFWFEYKFYQKLDFKNFLGIEEKFIPIWILFKTIENILWLLFFNELNNN